MEYNTARPKLKISEYGRNIQKMIEYAISIEDREKRTKMAKSIVNIMGRLNPNVNLNEVGDFSHKLWNHLFIISDFKLDVDAPYPVPSKNAILYDKKNKISYSNKDIKFRYYGHNIELIIKKAIDYEEGKEKDALVKTLTNHLKKIYINWNCDSVDDEVIMNHLSILSDGKLKLNKDDKLNETKDILDMNVAKKYSKRDNDTSRYKKRRTYR